MAKSGVIYLGSRPLAVAVNPGTKKLYLADNGSDSVIVADTVTKKVLKRISVEGEPVAIGINLGKNEIYLAAGDGLYFIDGKSDTLLDKLKLGGLPKKITVNEADGRIYVADYRPNDGGIYMIDAATRSLVKKVDAEFPQAIAVNSNTGKLYSAQLGGGTVSPVITGMEMVPSGERITISGWTDQGHRLGGRIRILSDDSLDEKKEFFLQ